MLSRILYLALAVFGLAAITFFATRSVIIDQAPKKVMANIESRIAAGAGGWNTCFHNREYGPRMNSARRANPDSIISSMAYDLSEGPVRISGEIWPRYWSISFYQQNSDNFFVKNDLELGEARFEFILALAEHDTSELVGTPVISPTDRGIMLIRRFAANADDMPGIRANQDAMSCGPA